MSGTNRARLHRNVQFIYERSLAKLELKSFGVKDFVSEESDPWSFAFNGAADLEEISEHSAYFGAINDGDTLYKKLILPEYQGGTYNVTRSVNQYLTHWIYPYKGKFHPQMVRALLNIMGVRRGQVVMDPFLGSGTTAIECMIKGIDFVGVDISPLCILISRVKTMAWEAADIIETRLMGGGEPVEGDHERVKEFMQLAELVTESDVAVRRRDRSTYLKKNLAKMLRSVQDMAEAKERFCLEFGKVRLETGDCRDLRSVHIPDDSVDAVVTSPPYSVALDYVKNDAHALKAMGLDLTTVREDFIGVRGKPKNRLALYNEDMKRVFGEIARVLRPGGSAAIVIGNATCGTEVTTTEEMKEWGEPHGLVFEREMPKIVYGLYSVITDEKILFFRRQGDGPHRCGPSPAR